MRGATQTQYIISQNCQFLLTHPLRGATGAATGTGAAGTDFYSHTPCGVQLITCLNSKSKKDFYSHTPCGVQRSYNIPVVSTVAISTHTPLAGCNKNVGIWACTQRPFLLTHPLRGATVNFIIFESPLLFLLTHPLRGATNELTPGDLVFFNFYSHTPCGVQRGVRMSDRETAKFLLTHPLRGATVYRIHQEIFLSISTHTPLAGCNRIILRRRLHNSHFYSHTPCGVQRTTVNNFNQH